MGEKTFNTRIVMKHDTEAKWMKAEDFKPLKGEMIIYDVDEEHCCPRIKIGNGEAVGTLPFVYEGFTASELESLCNQEMIAFAIENTLYEAVEGMTWSEWINSLYNVDGYIDNNSIIHNKYYATVTLSGGPVYSNEVIINNAAYELQTAEPVLV